MVSRRIAAVLLWLSSVGVVSTGVTSCSEPRVKGGKITIRNDILDKEFNTFVVDQVITANGASGYRRELSPGEERSLPFKHVTSFRITRRYQDHAKVYVVKCPRDFDVVTTMKLIDVHSNRLRGGCRLAKFGRSERGVVRWQ